MEKLAFNKFESEVIETVDLSPSVKNIKLSVPKDFNFIPGQYVSLIFSFEGKKIRRPYSISSMPNNSGYIDLCIKILETGIITPLISKLKKKDRVEILGPLGEFIIKNKSKEIVFISTGSGIGPFRSMVNSLLLNRFYHKITLIAGYKNEEEILYDKEFKNLEKKHKNFRYYTVLSKPLLNYTGDIGRVQNLIGKNITNIDNIDFYICGLNEMILSVKNLLLKKGVEMKNIYSEKYD